MVLEPYNVIVRVFLAWLHVVPFGFGLSNIDPVEYPDLLTGSVIDKSELLTVEEGLNVKQPVVIEGRILQGYHVGFLHMVVHEISAREHFNEGWHDKGHVMQLPIF